MKKRSENECTVQYSDVEAKKGTEKKENFDNSTFNNSSLLIARWVLLSDADGCRLAEMAIESYTQ